MKAWGITDIGLLRRENQDSFAIASGLSDNDIIALVCDGMGGASSGLLASSLAAETFVANAQLVLRPEMAEEQLREAIAYCVAKANSAVYERAKSSEKDRGMGTTLVAAVTRGDDVVLCNVGDSRAYHWKGTSLMQITRDHSVVEGLIESGDITAEEARNHPNRNLITRALGPENSTRCDVYFASLAAGEGILLCSDGLVVTMTDEEIAKTIAEEQSPAAQLKALIALARLRGAPDNVTAVLIYNN